MIWPSKSFPRDEGMIENVFEIPSLAFSYLNFATDSSEARAPLVSLPAIGFAPGASGSPAFLPSGVEPVFLP